MKAMMSLYNLYLLAISYELDSPQFEEVLQRALSLHRNEKLIRISMAIFSYMENNIAAALKFLEGMENEPEAWLYLSSIHVKMDDLEKAEYYAQKAVDVGNPDAREQLNRVNKCKIARRCAS